jgi:hypothetical protein
MLFSYAHLAQRRRFIGAHRRPATFVRACALARDVEISLVLLGILDARPARGVRE